MRTNIPAFRLPARGARRGDRDHRRHGRRPPPQHARHEPPKALLAQDYDAVFVGTGAPRGKDLDIPGRHESDRHPHRHRLARVGRLRAHRQDRRAGPHHRRRQHRDGLLPLVAAPRRQGHQGHGAASRATFFKASPWELEDAEEEEVEIVVNHAPTRFVIEDGTLTGMEFQRLEWDEQARHSTVIDTVVIPCDDVILAIGQENAFPWIERDLGLEFDKWDMPVVDKVTFQSSLPGVFFGGDAAWGPKNIIWAVEHGHQAAISIHNHCQGIAVTERPPQGMNLVEPEDGPQRVELQQRLQPLGAAEDAARRADPNGSRASAPRSSSASPPSRRRARCSAASTATSRRSSRRRSASSATRASTSARCSA